MQREAWAWAAGLFDGEGCIVLDRSHAYRRQVGLTLAMTDRDLVERFRDVVGGGTITIRPPDSGPRKQTLVVWRTGSFELSQYLIAALWPWLGERRRARAREVLTIVAAAQTRRRNQRRPAHCVADDCDRPVLARGLCSYHYGRARRAS